MSDQTFETMIVPAATQTEAQAIAAAFEGGAGMFTTACSSTGLSPATHYISSGFLDDAIVEALRDVPGIDISDEDPFVALARLDLKIVSDPS